MLLSEFKLNDNEPIYKQISNELKRMIEEGMLVEGSKLPSTRELSNILGVSRNSCVHAYELLEDEEYIQITKNKGAFVSHRFKKHDLRWRIGWEDKVSSFGKMAVKLDIIKSEMPTQKGMISFKSIAPDEKLFNLEQIRRDFLNSISVDGEKLFNYGYAKGYKPLIDYLKSYMQNKGVNLSDKDILITNGFTEGFDIVLSALTSAGDRVICENPTHNTAIKLMMLHSLELIGVNFKNGVMDTEQLKHELTDNTIKLIYLTPSYHNPTGTVMSANKRKEVYELCRTSKVPIIEDGFNEELLYSSSHVSSIAALAGEDNSVVYIGSFSKILFPGIRIGWIAADKKLIDVLESIKRSRNIHNSVLDQAFLYEYLRSGNFEIYLKKVRKYYKDKYMFAVNCAQKYIPGCKIYGEGGLHIFLELERIDARMLLDESIKRGVDFMPGDVFYIDKSSKNTLRLGFSRVGLKDIEKGFRIIGECIEKLQK
ncbi:PLP-dependent aminotransferase family protein [Clostridium swellfunianum]|uniref:aminotransferase-like domain-containing protein n=1 Tax=Clostridium swellfunianum TaxID=1367462 RepID=UPI00202E44E2|nr:PLP-dependent aminotransferase family protein [Clostridium swellfunianum]MCM0647986.1 PLP-dependent aminotransferase family protein [Clostridium swellfunianum]